MLIRLIEFANWEIAKYLSNILQTYIKHKMYSMNSHFEDTE